MDGTTAAFLNLIIPLIALAISLAILYLIIKSAVLVALREARREAWTEDYLPEKAKWLTERQRNELAAELRRRNGEPPVTG